MRSGGTLKAWLICTQPTGPAKRVPSLGKMVPRVIVLFMRLRATGPRAMRAATACRHAQVTAILLSIASKQPRHMPFIHR